MQNNQIFLFDNSNEDKNNFERISANNNYQNGQSNSQSLNNYNSNNSGNEDNNVPITNYNSNNINEKKLKKNAQTLNTKNSFYHSQDVDSVSGFSFVKEKHTRYYFQKIKMNNKEKYIRALCHEKIEAFFKYFFYIFSNIVNVINVIVYICQSYIEESNEKENTYEKVLSIIDFSCSIYFLIQFLLMVSIRRDIKHLFSWDCLIDLFTIIPSMIIFFLQESNLRTILRMCKVFRVLRIYKSIHTLQYDNSNESGILSISHIKLQLLSILIIFFNLFFIASGLVFGLQEIMPSSFNNKKMTFAECVYFIIVTATTVGYGDIYPTNTISRLFIILLIVSFISMVSYQLAKLIQLFQLWGNYAHYTITSHVILLVDSTIDLLEVLKEIKRENHRQEVIIISTQIESLPSSEFPYNKVYLIHTKTIDLDILERANAKYASYIIVFASINFVNYEQSEKVNEYIILKINQYFSSIPIYVQTLYTDKSFLNNSSAKKDEIFHFFHNESQPEVSISKIIPIFRIKSLIHAKSIFIPGFANFAQNLVLNNTETPSDFYSYDMAMQGYFLGCENSLQVLELPRFFTNLDFYEAMRQIYSKSIRDYIIKVSVHDMKDVNRPILLIGIIANIPKKNKKSSPVTKTILFPKNYKIPRKAMGIFITYNGENYLQNLLSSFPLKTSMSQREIEISEREESQEVLKQIKRRKGFSEDPEILNLNQKMFGKFKHKGSFSKQSNKNLLETLFSGSNKIVSNNSINNNETNINSNLDDSAFPNIIAKLNAIVTKAPRKNSFEEITNKKYENEGEEKENAYVSQSNLISSTMKHTFSQKTNLLKPSKTITSSFLNRNNMLREITVNKNGTNFAKSIFHRQNKNNEGLSEAEKEEMEEKRKRRNFFICKKNEIITGRGELKNNSTKNNLIFIESLDTEDLDKFIKNLIEQAKHRYRSDNIVNSDYTVDNRTFDCAKTNISEVFANHILFVGYQDGLHKLIKIIQLHFPYKDICIMTNYSFDDNLIVKYLKVFKHLYHLRGEVSNPTHLINAGIAKASNVVFLVDKIDLKTNEDMAKILGFRAVDYFFQTSLFLELWDHSSVYLLGYNPISKKSSITKNEFFHPLYIGGKLLYLDHLNRVICMSQKDKQKIDAWIELLSLGYKTNSNTGRKGSNILINQEKSGYPVMITVDLPEKYIGKEFFNIFTDLICQQNPIMILGIYIENPLDYNQLRSEGRINRFTRMQTNQLKIITSHKKVLMNMNALSKNEQDYLSYLRMLKDISYNDKILLDSLDLRHPFFPIFITNPPPWFILTQGVRILVLFFHEPNIENDLMMFQKQFCRTQRKGKKEYFGTGINQRNKVLLNQRQENFYLTLNVFKEKIQKKYTDAFKELERDATLKRTLIFNSRKKSNAAN